MRTSLALFVLLVACDTTEAPDGGAAPDSGPGEVDAGSVAVECDPAPAPQVAGTAESDALADAPARCGQPAHQWLRDPGLGDVVDVGAPTGYSRRILQGLADGQGVVLPRPIGSDVDLRTIRYTTQDRGALVESTAVVAYPTGLAPGAPLDALLFLHGTSGFTQACGPTEDATAKLLIAVFASFGYLVVAPDFLGLESGAVSYPDLHPYLVGQATAIASLDALRAALRLTPEQRGRACASTRFVSVGGSQGGHAALWIDRLHPYYARELDHAGVVATVPPADLLGQVDRGMRELVDASQNSAAFWATAPAWYEADDRLDEVLAAPLDVELPAALARECSPNDFDSVSTIEEAFAGPALDAAAAGTLADYAPWGCFLTENGLTTTSVPRISDDPDSYGIFFVTGSDDPLVHTPLERAAYTALCDAGLPLRYLECEGADHGATAWALPELIRFAEARLAGEAFERPASCEPPAAVRCEGTP